MNKKIILFSLSCLVAILALTYKNHQSKTVLNIPSSILDIENPKTLSEIYAVTPVVLVGKVRDIVKNDSEVAKFFIDVVSDIKGNSEKDIIQYDSIREVDMEKGKTYLLFLDKTYLPTYPSPRYTLYYKHLAFEVNNRGQLILDNSYDNFWGDAPKTLDELASHLRDRKSVV